MVKQCKTYVVEYPLHKSDTHLGERNGLVKRHGQGVLTEFDGSKYDGEWKDGKQNGQGVLIKFVGGQYASTYIGAFDHNQYNGTGTLYHGNGTTHEGNLRMVKKMATLLLPLHMVR